MNDVIDDGETNSNMEPLIPQEASPARRELDDLARDLLTKSAGLRTRLPKGLHEPLAGLVRSMDCYYSNLIEGHDTHPVDIEKALKNDFSQDSKARSLQLEALSHMKVQHWIDEGGLVESPLHNDSIRELHRRLCEGIPAELLQLERGAGEFVALVPGEFRRGFVRVGRHIAPSPGSVPRLFSHLDRMHRAQGRLGKIVFTACAHHRAVWIHPFDDLNGRVVRMMSHAMLCNHLNSGGLWSASRALGQDSKEYKRRLAAADDARHGNADGRGALSEARLFEFAKFFLAGCIDQVDFMSDLMQPGDLQRRVAGWASREIERGVLPKGSERVMRAVLGEGELDRSVVPEMLGVGDRQAGKVTLRLFELEAITSDGPRSPLKPHFPASLAGEWMPGLFPEKC